MAYHQIVSRIGQQIRAVRLQRKLTIQELAVRTNVTKGLLSKIENFRTIPSLPVFIKILESLDIPLTDFFDDMLRDNQGKGFWHIRKSQFTYAGHAGRPDSESRQFASPNLPGSTAEICLLRIGPGSIGNPSIADGYKFLYIISGSLDCHVGDEVIKLEEGDSIFLDANVPHLAVNASERDALMVAVFFRLNNSTSHAAHSSGQRPSKTDLPHGE